LSILQIVVVEKQLLQLLVTVKMLRLVREVELRPNYVTWRISGGKPSL